MRLFPVVVFFSSFLAVAADPVLIDGADSSEPVPARCVPAIQCTAKLSPTEQVRVEAGSDGRNADGQLVHAGQTVVKYQLIQGIELNVYTNTLALLGREPTSHEGFQPGVRVSLLDESEWFPSLGLFAYFAMPTFDPSQTWNFEGWWSMSKTAGPFAANLNLIWSVNDLADTRSSHGLGMLTLSGSLSGGVSVFGEAFATWGVSQVLPPGVGLFSGVSMAATDELVLDLGAELALHDARLPIVTVFAGVTWVPEGGQKPMPVAPVLARR